jgi:hypothetical protein
VTHPSTVPYRQNVWLLIHLLRLQKQAAIVPAQSALTTQQK